MNRRHAEEIDRAVSLAHRAATVGRMQDPDLLTRFLYQRWYLGRTPAPIPAQRARRDVRRTQPNQPWRAWGAGWEDRTARGSDLVRLHLSCAPHTSLHALATVTRAAQDWTHPWLLTSRAINQAVPSPDATVLYLPGEAVAELQPQLARLVEELQPFLAHTVPALTLRIGRGATLAQNPGGATSYGEHRCGLIAHAVLTHLHRPHVVLVNRTLARFAAAEVDPRRPYRRIDAQWEWRPVRAAA